jgi:hypothetical protein
MSRYLYLYRGPSRLEQFTPEESAEQLAAWGEWMGRVGPALVDPGAPLGDRTAVSDTGKVVQPSEMSGYSVVEADSLEAAKAFLDKHPFLTEGKGRFAVEVFELVPIEM